DGGAVVAPDRVDQVTREYQARPARRAVAAREHELGVGEPRVARCDRIRVKRTEFRGRGGVAIVYGAEQVLGLMLELCEIRPNGQVTSGHNEPPRMPEVRSRRAEGGS